MIRRSIFADCTCLVTERTNAAAATAGMCFVKSWPQLYLIRPRVAMTTARCERKPPPPPPLIHTHSCVFFSRRLYFYNYTQKLDQPMLMMLSCFCCPVANSSYHLLLLLLLLYPSRHCIIFIHVKQNRCYVIRDVCLCQQTRLLFLSISDDGKRNKSQVVV